MARAHSRLLVIDASVARAAGPEDAVHPRAKSCRDFLLAVQEICHRAIFTAAIAEEWKKHRSGFAHGWRLSMFSRKKIARMKIAEDPALREQLEQAVATQKDKAAILKDAHLIEAALAQGMCIVALDETVRELFRTAARSIACLRKVCWVNPEKPDDEPLEWLRTGAPFSRHRMLGFHVKED